MDGLKFLPSKPEDNLVLIRIITASITRTDNFQRAGGHPSPWYTQPGFSLGHGFVREIITLGPDA